VLEGLLTTALGTRVLNPPDLESEVRAEAVRPEGLSPIDGARPVAFRVVGSEEHVVVTPKPALAVGRNDAGERLANLPRPAVCRIVGLEVSALYCLGVAMFSACFVPPRFQKQYRPRRLYSKAKRNCRFASTVIFLRGTKASKTERFLMEKKGQRFSKDTSRRNANTVSKIERYDQPRSRVILYCVKSKK